MESHSVIFHNGQKRLLDAGATATALFIWPLIQPGAVGAGGGFTVPCQSDEDAQYVIGGATNVGAGVAMTGPLPVWKNGCWSMVWDAKDITTATAMTVYGYVVSEGNAGADSGPSSILWATWLGPLPTGLLGLPTAWASPGSSTTGPAPFRTVGTNEKLWVIPQLTWACGDSCSTGCGC